MISAAKARAKRHWPKLRLRTILLATLVFVAALPGFAAMFLRVYENTLVRQTEAELIAQGAALVAAAKRAGPARRRAAAARLPAGRAADRPQRQPDPAAAAAARKRSSRPDAAPWPPRGCSSR
jgi:hypothetical protein